MRDGPLTAKLLIMKMISGRRLFSSVLAKSGAPMISHFSFRRKDFE